MERAKPMKHERVSITRLPASVRGARQECESVSPVSEILDGMVAFGPFFHLHIGLAGRCWLGQS